MAEKTHVVSQQMSIEILSMWCMHVFERVCIILDLSE